MTAYNIPRSACGLLARQDDQHYPYFLPGAGFLMTYEDYGFFVTAKHVILKVSSGTVLEIPTSPTETLILGKQGIVDGEESFNDLAFFPFPIEKLRESTPEWDSLALPLNTSIVRIGHENCYTGAPLSVVGLPEDARGIDYGTKRVAFEVAALDAKYDCRDSRRGIHRGRFTESAGLLSYHGFSGSPVFTMTPPFVGFAGCVIEAGELTGPFHFIDSAVVLRAAATACRDLRKGSA